MARHYHAVFLVALILLPSIGAMYSGSVINNDRAEAAVADVNDHGTRRTVAVITRNASETVEGPGQAELVPCLYLATPVGGERITVTSSYGCQAGPLPAFPSIDILGGSKAVRGPCGADAKCFSNTAILNVGGLWAGTVVVEIHLPEGTSETVNVVYPLQQYRTIHVNAFVDTRNLSSYDVSVTVMGDTGTILDREVATVSVVPRPAGSFTILDAVTRATPRGYVTFASGIASGTTDLCIAPVPVPSEAEQRVVGRASTAVFARYVTLKPTLMGFGPGRDCSNLVATLPVTELRGGT